MKPDYCIVQNLMNDVSWSFSESGSGPPQRGAGTSVFKGLLNPNILQTDRLVSFFTDPMKIPTFDKSDTSPTDETHRQVQQEATHDYYHVLADATCDGTDAVPLSEIEAVSKMLLSALTSTDQPTLPITPLSSLLQTSKLLSNSAMPDSATFCKGTFAVDIRTLEAAHDFNACIDLYMNLLEYYVSEGDDTSAAVVMTDFASTLKRYAGHFLNNSADHRERQEMALLSTFMFLFGCAAVPFTAIRLVQMFTDILLQIAHDDEPLTIYIKAQICAGTMHWRSSLSDQECEALLVSARSTCVDAFVHLQKLYTMRTGSLVPIVSYLTFFEEFTHISENERSTDSTSISDIFFQENYQSRRTPRYSLGSSRVKSLSSDQTEVISARMSTLTAVPSNLPAGPLLWSSRTMHSSHHLSNSVTASMELPHKQGLDGASDALLFSMSITDTSDQLDHESNMFPVVRYKFFSHRARLFDLCESRDHSDPRFDILEPPFLHLAAIASLLVTIYSFVDNVSMQPEQSGLGSAARGTGGPTAESMYSYYSLEDPAGGEQSNSSSSPDGADMRGSVLRKLNYRNSMRLAIMHESGKLSNLTAATDTHEEKATASLNNSSNAMLINLPSSRLPPLSSVSDCKDYQQGRSPRLEPLEFGQHDARRTSGSPDKLSHREGMINICKPSELCVTGIDHEHSGNRTASYQPSSMLIVNDDDAHAYSYHSRSSDVSEWENPSTENFSSNEADTSMSAHRSPIISPKGSSARVKQVTRNTRNSPAIAVMSRTSYLKGYRGNSLHTQHLLQVPLGKNADDSRQSTSRICYRHGAPQFTRGFRSAGNLLSRCYADHLADTAQLLERRCYLQNGSLDCHHGRSSHKHGVVRSAGGNRRQMLMKLRGIFGSGDSSTNSFARHRTTSQLQLTTSAVTHPHYENSSTKLSLEFDKNASDFALNVHSTDLSGSLGGYIAIDDVQKKLGASTDIPPAIDGSRILDVSHLKKTLSYPPNIVSLLLSISPSLPVHCAERMHVAIALKNTVENFVAEVTTLKFTSDHTTPRTVPTQIPSLPQPFLASDPCSGPTAVPPLNIQGLEPKNFAPRRHSHPNMGSRPSSRETSHTTQPVTNQFYNIHTVNSIMVTALLCLAKQYCNRMKHVLYVFRPLIMSFMRDLTINNDNHGHDGVTTRLCRVWVDCILNVPRLSAREDVFRAYRYQIHAFKKAGDWCMELLYSIRLLDCLTNGSFMSLEGLDVRDQVVTLAVDVATTLQEHGEPSVAQDYLCYACQVASKDATVLFDTRKPRGITTSDPTWPAGAVSLANPNFAKGSRTRGGGHTLPGGSMHQCDSQQIEKVDVTIPGARGARANTTIFQHDVSIAESSDICPLQPSMRSIIKQVSSVRLSIILSAINSDKESCVSMNPPKSVRSVDPDGSSDNMISSYSQSSRATDKRKLSGTVIEIYLKRAEYLTNTGSHDTAYSLLTELLKRTNGNAFARLSILPELCEIQLQRSPNITRDSAGIFFEYERAILDAALPDSSLMDQPDMLQKIVRACIIISRYYLAIGCFSEALLVLQTATRSISPTDTGLRMDVEVTRAKIYCQLFSVDTNITSSTSIAGSATVFPIRFTPFAGLLTPQALRGNLRTCMVPGINLFLNLPVVFPYSDPTPPLYAGATKKQPQLTPDRKSAMKGKEVFSSANLFRCETITEGQLIRYTFSSLLSALDLVESVGGASEKVFLIDSLLQVATTVLFRGKPTHSLMPDHSLLRIERNGNFSITVDRLDFTHAHDIVKRVSKQKDWMQSSSLSVKTVAPSASGSDKRVRIDRRYLLSLVRNAIQLSTYSTNLMLNCSLLLSFAEISILSSAHDTEPRAVLSHVGDVIYELFLCGPVPLPTLFPVSQKLLCSLHNIISRIVRGCLHLDPVPSFLLLFADAHMTIAAHLRNSFAHESWPSKGISKLALDHMLSETTPPGATESPTSVKAPVLLSRAFSHSCIPMGMGYSLDILRKFNRALSPRSTQLSAKQADSDALENIRVPISTALSNLWKDPRTPSDLRQLYSQPSYSSISNLPHNSRRMPALTTMRVLNASSLIYNFKNNFKREMLSKLSSSKPNDTTITPSTRSSLSALATDLLKLQSTAVDAVKSPHVLCHTVSTVASYPLLTTKCPMMSNSSTVHMLQKHQGDFLTLPGLAEFLTSYDHLSRSLMSSLGWCISESTLSSLLTKQFLHYCSNIDADLANESIDTLIDLYPLYVMSNISLFQCPRIDLESSNVTQNAYGSSREYVKILAEALSFPVATNQRFYALNIMLTDIIDLKKNIGTTASIYDDSTTNPIEQPAALNDKVTSVKTCSRPNNEEDVASTARSRPSSALKRSVASMDLFNSGSSFQTQSDNSDVIIAMPLPTPGGNQHSLAVKSSTFTQQLKMLCIALRQSASCMRSALSRINGAVVLHTLSQTTAQLYSDVFESKVDSKILETPMIFLVGGVTYLASVGVCTHLPEYADRRMKVPITSASSESIILYGKEKPTQISNPSNGQLDSPECPPNTKYCAATQQFSALPPTTSNIVSHNMPTRHANAHSLILPELPRKVIPDAMPDTGRRFSNTSSHLRYAAVSLPSLPSVQVATLPNDVKHTLDSSPVANAEPANQEMLTNAPPHRNSYKRNTLASVSEKSLGISPLLTDNGDIDSIALDDSRKLSTTVPGTNSDFREADTPENQDAIYGEFRTGCSGYLPVSLLEEHVVLGLRALCREKNQGRLDINFSISSSSNANPKSWGTLEKVAVCSGLKECPLLSNFRVRRMNLVDALPEGKRFLDITSNSAAGLSANFAEKISYTLYNEWLKIVNVLENSMAHITMTIDDTASFFESCLDTPYFIVDSSISFVSWEALCGTGGVRHQTVLALLAQTRDEAVTTTLCNSLQRKVYNSIAALTQVPRGTREITKFLTTELKVNGGIVSVENIPEKGLVQIIQNTTNISHFLKDARVTDLIMPHISRLRVSAFIDTKTPNASINEEARREQTLSNAHRVLGYTGDDVTASIFSTGTLTPSFMPPSTEQLLPYHTPLLKLGALGPSISSKSYVKAVIYEDSSRFTPMEAIACISGRSGILTPSLDHAVPILRLSRATIDIDSKYSLFKSIDTHICERGFTEAVARFSLLDTGIRVSFCEQPVLVLPLADLYEMTDAVLVALNMAPTIPIVFLPGHYITDFVRFVSTASDYIEKSARADSKNFRIRKSQDVLAIRPRLLVRSLVITAERVLGTTVALFNAGT